MKRAQTKPAPASFRLVEVEVTAPLSAVHVGDDEAGVMLLVRRRGRPVGFAIERLDAGSTIRAAELWRMAQHAAGAALVAEAMLDELPAIVERAEPSPSLTIAVCTRDRADVLPRCLEALTTRVPMRDEASRGAVEVLVVDNAPADEATAECVARFPSVRYVREPRAGLDFARNRALAEARGEWVAFVDDDAVVDHGWYDGFVDAWRRDPGAGAITGLVLPLELETEAQLLFELRGGFRRGFARLRYAGDTLPGNPVYPAGAGIFGAGCNMALRREVALALGGFDEALDVGTPTNGGGDLDMFYRVVRAGHPLLYEPSQLVFHQHRRGLEELRRQYWTWGCGFMAFVAKSWRTDAAARPRLAGVVRWWFGDQLRQIARSVRGRHPLPPRFLVAELRGAFVGLGGAYDRALRHARRQRALHEPEPHGRELRAGATA